MTQKNPFGPVIWTTPKKIEPSWILISKDYWSRNTKFVSNLTVNQRKS